MKMYRVGFKKYSSSATAIDFVKLIFAYSHIA